MITPIDHMLITAHQDAVIVGFDAPAAGNREPQRAIKRITTSNAQTLVYQLLTAIDQARAYGEYQRGEVTDKPRKRRKRRPPVKAPTANSRKE
ncbi:hypothetical protein ACMA1D_10760 [Streptomyces sp. 796.1]|uniref:hypothetical protein n=1 Tax=Streptomyces sp. 796.1 TaxID=3163029 RepID=UPI0039C93720